MNGEIPPQREFVTLEAGDAEEPEEAEATGIGIGRAMPRRKPRAKPRLRHDGGDDPLFARGGT